MRTNLVEHEMQLDRRRRTHLGILRDEMRGKTYGRHFRWEMNPLSTMVEESLKCGEAATENVLSRKDVNRLLDPGYLPLETGFAILPDGTGHVAVLTEFPNATGEMIDWWFSWHGLETERYKLWHPQAHLFSQMRYQRTPGEANNRKVYIGNTSYVDEYIGPNIQRLAITFYEPGEFGFEESLFGAAGISTAICARVGLSDRPIDTGYVIHLVRETSQGCEMRSRFWLGEPHLRKLPEQNPIDRILNTRFLRRRIISDRLCRDLFIHCAEEMNHLAEFLPSLFEQEVRI